MTPIDFEQLQARLTQTETRHRRRAVVLTLIPIIVGALVLGYVAYAVTGARRELASVRREMMAATSETQRAQLELKKASRTLTQILQITNEMQEFIERKQSFLRTLDEARFLISIRMMFDRIDTQYRDAAKYLPELPPLNQRRWVTVLMSSRDLSALKLSAQAWSQRVPKTDLAIYASHSGYYALVIKGDGSFTFAYNKTVELQKSGTAGAYFAESENWGKDYLAG
jgi:hypothetical protein